MDSIIEKIRKDIEKTGFLSELNTITKLLKYGWDAEHSFIYVDKDEKKSREIDIIGSNLYKDSEINFDIDIVLIIEVKKSSKPWIIFTSEFDSNFWAPGFKVSGYNIYKWVRMEADFVTREPDRLEPTDILDLKSLSKLIYPDDYPRIGKAFHELGKEGNQPSQIYAALMGLSKAVVSFDDLNYPDKLIDTDFAPNNKKTLSVYLPIVVLDGKLFEVFNDKAGELNIMEKEMIPVDFRLISENYENYGYGLHLTQTIVTYEGLDNYINQLDSNLKILLKEFSLQFRDHMNEIDKK